MAEPLFVDNARKDAGPDRGRVVGAGVLAGIVGALALWLFSLITTAAQGGPFWPTFKSAARPLLGAERVMAPGFDVIAVALGTLAHFAVSITWGVLFALLFFGLSRGATLLAGVFWSFVVWLAMFYVVLPIIGAYEVTRNVPVGWAIVQHLIFGLAVALTFLPFQKSLPQRRGRVPKRVSVRRHAEA